MRLFDEKTNAPIDLPAELTTFRGDTVSVAEIAEDSSPGRSGKLLVGSPGTTWNTIYPGVVGCYIAAAAREEVQV
jgi:hypothetical protein